jgi:alkyl sulfatase BDS1-like metallo-beta-lactamase superfamily hydrolase
MAGWEANINSLQFGTVIPSERVEAISSYTFPDFTYRDHQRLELAGESVELYHAKGETEDATWVWLPEREAAIVGDLIVSSMPNTGHPTKPQRFTLQWAEALESIAAKKPRFVLPGHGPVYRGATCQEVLWDTARALRLIHDEVIRRLNRREWPIDIIEADIRLPPALSRKPHLREIYGCVPFVVRDVLRSYGGWWSGQPSQLFPPRRREHAADVVQLCGRYALLARVRALLFLGENERAVALAELVANYDPRDREARRMYIKSIERLAESKTSFIARNMLRGVANNLYRR